MASWSLGGVWQVWLRIVDLKSGSVANNKSSKKRVEIAERNRLQNKAYKSAMRTLMKRCFSACDAYTATPGDEAGHGSVQPECSLQQNRQGGQARRSASQHRCPQKARLTVAVKKAIDPAPTAG